MCTLEKRGSLFILTVTGATKEDTEHCLSPDVIQSVRSALAEVKAQASASGSALLTRSEGKFFSNGLDFRHVRAVGEKAGSADAARAELRRMVNLFRGVVADLLSLPMPTVAAVNGHAAATGMILAMSHDYVMMTSSRGFMYMSELDIGITFPDYFSALLRSKIRSGIARKEVMLAAAKVRAEAALRMGIVDSVHETAEEVAAAAERKAVELARRGWNGQVYAEIRKAMYPEVCGVLGLKDRPLVVARL